MAVQAAVILIYREKGIEELHEFENMQRLDVQLARSSITIFVTKKQSVSTKSHKDI